MYTSQDSFSGLLPYDADNAFHDIQHVQNKAVSQYSMGTGNPYAKF